MQANLQSAPARRIATVRRLDALFQAMASDFLLREQFITDPSQIVAEYIYGDSIPPEQAAATNHLIYATLENAGMRRWLRTYCASRRAAAPDAADFTQAFASAVVAAKAHHVVYSLIATAASRTGFAGMHEDLLHWLVTVGARNSQRVIEVEEQFEEDEVDDGDGGTGDGGTGDGGTGDGGTGDGGTGDGGTGDGGTGDGGTGDGGTGDGGTGDGGTGDGGTGDGGTGDGGTGDGGTGDGGTGTGTMTSITWTTYITTGDGGTRTGTGPFTQTGGGTRGPFTNDRLGGSFDEGFAPRYVLVTLEALSRYAIGLAQAGALTPARQPAKAAGNDAPR